MTTSTKTEATLFAAYLPANQAWAVFFGRRNAPPSEWAWTDVDGRKLWEGGRREGRAQLARDLERMGLRFSGDERNAIVVK